MAARKSQSRPDAVWESPNGKWYIRRMEPNLEPDPDNPYSTLAVVYLSDGYTGGEVSINVRGDVTYDDNIRYGAPQYARDKAESILRADRKAAMSGRPKASPNRRTSKSYRITALYLDPQESRQFGRSVYDAIAKDPGKGDVWLKDYYPSTGGFMAEYPRQSLADLINHVKGHKLIMGDAPKAVPKRPKASKNIGHSDLVWDLCQFFFDYDTYEFRDLYGDMETAVAVEGPVLSTKHGREVAIAFLEDEVDEIDYDDDLEKRRKSLIRRLKALNATSDTSEASKVSQNARRTAKKGNAGRTKSSKAVRSQPRGKDGRFVSKKGRRSRCRGSPRCRCATYATASPWAWGSRDSPSAP